jgi:hypothetical protein
VVAWLGGPAGAPPPPPVVSNDAAACGHNHGELVDPHPQQQAAQHGW